MARWFVIGSLFGVLVVLGAMAAFGQSYAGRVLPGIVLGGVDIGGMTEAEARQALDAALGGLEDGQIELVSSRTTAVIPYADVGRVIDDEGMLANALGLGRDGTKFEEAVAGIRGLLEPVTLPVVIDYDHDRLATGLAVFRDLGERSPVDASVAFQRTAFMAMPAAEGVAVDTTRIASLIDQALVDPSDAVRHPRDGRLPADQPFDLGRGRGTRDHRRRAHRRPDRGHRWKADMDDHPGAHRVLDELRRDGRRLRARHRPRRRAGRPQVDPEGSR